MIGRTISHYRLTEQLGEGGMGVVYRAEDLRLGREVAIKFLKPDVSVEAHPLERFRLEARAASALNHPNICTVYDIDEHEGQSFIVMELIEGETLRERLEASHMEPRAAITAGVQIADALAAAHAKGIIHRDIKPENIFLTGAGCIKVVDFGIAKLVQSPSGLTTSVHGLALALTDRLDPELTPVGAPVGTVAYASPEQLRGQELDPGTDIFSVGVLLYELGTGVSPFAASTLSETADAVMNRDPPPPSRLCPTLPAGFDGVVSRALAKHRQSRYGTIAELGADLERIRDQGSTGPPTTGATWSRRRVLAYGIVAIGLVAAALGLTSLVEDGPATRGDPQPLDSLVVLPLQELSGPDSLLADGMTEALISRLARIPGLRVISRTSAMTYEDTHKPLRQIARELGVQAVVEGSVLGSGTHVRVTARLVRASDDRSIWSETYDRELRDVLVLQGELAGAIAGQVQVALTPEESARVTQAHPVDPEAHYLLLRGRLEMSKGTPPSTERALEDFQAAVELEPGFALAWVGIADAYETLSGTGFDWLPGRDAQPRARAAAERALEIEPSGEAHAVLAEVAREHDYDWTRAAQEYTQALALSPGSAEVHREYSTYLRDLGRSAEAIAEAKKAIALDPLSLPARDNLAWCYYAARRFEEADAISRRTVSVEPDFPFSRLQRGANLLALDRPGEALRELQKFRELTADGPLAIAFVALAEARLGHKGEAEAGLRRLRELSAHRHVPAYHMALVHNALGDREQALMWFERAVDDRSPAISHAAVEPLADDLRGLTRFQTLLRRMGLPVLPLPGADS